MSKARANADATSQTYIENATAAQELSGTYATGTERLYFNDLYTLTGDVTIQENAHLALGTIADKDVTIEADTDSTEREINGEGTLESGELLSSKQTDLTDMTGELGSVVTGSPNLNLTTGTLGSGVTFPAGHVVQTVTTTQSAQVNFGGGGWATITGMAVSIKPKYSDSKILVTFSAGGSAGDGSESYIYSLIEVTDTGGRSANAHYNAQGYGHHTSGSWLSIPIIVRCVDLPANTNKQTYQLKMRTTAGSTTGAVVNYGSSGGDQEGVSTAMEIKV